jgi:hypothetical protein
LKPTFQGDFLTFVFMNIFDIYLVHIDSHHRRPLQQLQ